MNRAEYRRQKREKEKSAAVITMTAGQIEQVKREAYEKALRNVFAIALTIPALVIHDHFGQLMKKDGRVQTFFDLNLQTWGMIESGHLDVEDAMQILDEELSVDISALAEDWRRKREKEAL